MNLTTTYTVKMQNGSVWVFKYNLNGILVYFNVLEGELSESQQNFLYPQGNFPWRELHIKEWSKRFKTTIVEVGERDISFEALWNLYNHKVKRVEAEKQFKKLKEQEILLCFLSISGYNKYLQKKGTAKAHLSTFINQRYFEDDWSKAI
jgi:hypothetical protein